MLRPPLKNGLTLVAVLAVLLAFDRAITPRDARHSELAGLRAQARGLKEKPDADVLVVGSSTIGQWLTPNLLAWIINVPSKTILDGHLGACYATCSLSVVQNLETQGRKFREVFAGVNLFSMCDELRPNRVMQNIELSPMGKLPKVLALYSNSAKPFTHWGTAAAMLFSHAYRDTTFQHDRLAIGVFGKRHEPNLWRFDTPEPKAKRAESERVDSCDYEPTSVAVQLRFLNEELAELSNISEHIYLLSLPQRSLSNVGAEPEMHATWEKHRQTLKALVQMHPKVTLLDMTTNGIDQTRFFNDPIHLSPAGIRHQSQRLRTLVHARAVHGK